MARRMIWRVMHSWAAAGVAAAWLLFLAVTTAWPASWWFTVQRVLVYDAPAGAEVVMDVDRRIYRPFVAEWSVLVRRRVGEGWKIACTADGKGDYRTDAVLPVPLTLRWWTDGEPACAPAALGPGEYFVSTIWTIQGVGALPDKVVQVASNVFTIEAEKAGR